MGAVLETLPLTILAASLAITFLGGFVKGTVGFALPLIMISGLSAILPPQIALAALLLPALLTNMWQALRQGLGPALGSLRAHWPFVTIGLGVMAASAQVVLAVPQWAFFAIIGIPVAIYSALQWKGNAWSSTNSNYRFEWKPNYRYARYKNFCKSQSS